MNYQNKEEMKRMWCLMVLFYLFSNSGILAQNVQIVNKTGLLFDSILVFHERIKERNTYEYNPESRFNPINSNFKKIRIDTLLYKNTVELNQQDTFTLKFYGKSDTVCYIFGLNPSKTKKIKLTNKNCVFSQLSTKSFAIKDSTGYLYDSVYVTDYPQFVTEIGGCVYFNFINKTNDAIYAIYPKISDENFYRGTILFHDPERKIMPNENRVIAFIYDRWTDQFSDQTFKFKILAISKENKLKEYFVDGVSANDSDVVITASGKK
jgi:hypothetical protein